MIWYIYAKTAYIYFLKDHIYRESCFGKHGFVEIATVFHQIKEISKIVGHGHAVGHVTKLAAL